MALAAFLIVAAGILGVWKATSSTIRQDFRDHLTSLALVAAQQVDPELHRQLRMPAQANSAAYQRAIEPLRRMRLALPEVHAIYTMVRGQDGLVHYVLDAADPGNHDGNSVDNASAVWEVYENLDPTTNVALGDGVNLGRAAATPEPTIDKRGSWMSGMAPLVDGSGEQFGIVGVKVDSSRFISHLEQARFLSFSGLVPAALLIAALGFAYFRVRMRGLVAEVDAEHSAREAHRSQLRLAGIIESTNVGTWESTVDPESTGGDELTVDEPWAAMLGRTAEELNPLTLSRFFSMLVHPDDAPMVHAVINEALREEGRMIAFDVRMRHARGHWVWSEVRGKVVQRDARGRPLRMVGTQMDATARKEAELAMQRSETNFRSLFELSPVGICQVEPRSGRFLMVNDSLARSTGYSREELLRMTFWDITPPEWHDAERAEQANHTSQGSFSMYEKEYRRKDGTRYPVLVSGTHHVDPLGREIGWAIVQDISGRKDAERVLAETVRVSTLR